MVISTGSVNCPKCNGTGKEIKDGIISSHKEETCHICSGTGNVEIGDIYIDKGGGDD
jgi:DnaJ-class molecular chaperone